MFKAGWFCLTGTRGDWDLGRQMAGPIGSRSQERVKRLKRNALKIEGATF